LKLQQGEYVKARDISKHGCHALASWPPSSYSSPTASAYVHMSFPFWISVFFDRQHTTLRFTPRCSIKFQFVSLDCIGWIAKNLNERCTWGSVHWKKEFLRGTYWIWILSLGAPLSSKNIIHTQKDKPNVLSGDECIQM
jgi:hypothetical protein